MLVAQRSMPGRSGRSGRRPTGGRGSGEGRTHPAAGARCRGRRLARARALQGHRRARPAPEARRGRRGPHPRDRRRGTDDRPVSVGGGGATAAGGTKAGKRARAMVDAVLAEHREHLAQLRARLVLPPRLATASPRPSPTPPPVPAGRHKILAGLAAAEAAASDRLVAQLPAVPPAVAQLMASIAASEAAHVVQLGYGRLAP